MRKYGCPKRLATGGSYTRRQLKQTNYRVWASKPLILDGALKKRYRILLTITQLTRAWCQREVLKKYANYKSLSMYVKRRAYSTKRYLRMITD
ncbi:hypothetical protein NDU88_006657 [Pleurodeles waltl]|uniref:Uncharacterized protein n=1 Tax=Pleurodeles waltl TaxID=8319 RepID=A0AAV7NSL7_PLEWA|nr:hypothetical protein NDU88_006657 [Pleurodeles waltl]